MSLRVQYWKLWGQSRSTVAYVLAVELLATAVTAITIRADADHAGMRSILAEMASVGGHPGWVVSVVIVIAAVIQIESDRRALRLRRSVFVENDHPFDFLGVWMVSTAVLLPPSLFTPAIIAIHLYSWRRIASVQVPLFKSIFTLSTILLAAQASRGAATFFAGHLTVGAWLVGNSWVALPSVAVPVLDWIPTVALALLAYTFCNQALVIGVIKLTNPIMRFPKILGTREDQLAELLTLVLGAVTFGLIAFNLVYVIAVSAGLVIFQRDLTIRQLGKAIKYDPKTQLLTLAAWRERVIEALNLSLRADRNMCRRFRRSRVRRLGAPGLRVRTVHMTEIPVGVLMCDIDHFKRLNDTYGHLAGDVALRAISDILKENVRCEDIVGRFGGEEFIILLRHPAVRTNSRASRMPVQNARAAVFATAERIRLAVAENKFLLGPDAGAPSLGNITVSIGAAIINADCDAEKLLDVMSTADAALYIAKRSGRNRVHIVDMYGAESVNFRAVLDPIGSADAPTDPIHGPETGPDIPVVVP